MNVGDIDLNADSLCGVDNKYEIRKDQIISIFVCAGFFLKQFYFSSSGSIQLGDIVLFLGFILFLCYNRFVLYRIDLPVAIFLLAVISINFLYSMIYSESSFLMKSLFMIYNVLIACIMFRRLISNARFLKYICFTFKAILICQLIVLVSGIGKWVFSGSRYVGTFNDPNQYGFYVLSSLLGIYVICTITRNKTKLIWVIIALIEILMSASTGILIGFLIFGVGYMLFFGGEKLTPTKIVIAVLMFFAGIILLLNINILFQYALQSDIFAIKRIVMRLSNGNSNTQGNIIANFISDRGLTKAFDHPIYFLFGSGDGLWTRFSSTSYTELHSTIISIAFCYGLIPFVLFIYWLRNNLSNLKFTCWFAYAALVIECFTLLNHRQPVFWFLIILASHNLCKKELSDSKRIQVFSKKV